MMTNQKHPKIQNKISYKNLTFLKLFKNSEFVKLGNKTKKPTHTLNKNYEISEIANFSDVGLLLPKNIVVIDFDLPTLKDKKIVENLIFRGVFNEYIILKTKRGYHIYCWSDEQFNNTSKKINFLGLEFDIKSFGFHQNGLTKKSFVKIRDNFEFREIINLPKIERLEQLGKIEIWMTPIPNKFFHNLNFEIGERNNNLFILSRKLMGLNWSHENIENLLNLINNYIFRLPLEIKELKNIYNFERREEYLKNPNFDFYDDKGHLDKLAIAKFLIHKYHAVKLKIAENDNSKNFYYYSDDDYYSLMKNGKIKSEILNILQGKISNERQLKDIVALVGDLGVEFFKTKDVEFIDRSLTFNCKNGILLIDEKKQKTLINHNKNIFTTHKFNFNYNPKIIQTASKKTKEIVKKWLFVDVCDSNLAKFQTLLKIICATFCFDWQGQKAFILLGDGGNGKSTFLNFLREIHGKENVSNLDIVKFGEKFNLSKLVDKTINICNDLENSTLPKAAVFKMCITKEIVMMEDKHQTPFDYRPTCNFIFASNDLPKFTEKTDAIGERLVFFKFNNKFRDTKNQNQHFFKTINQPEIYDYVANLALNFLDEVLFEKWSDFDECEKLQKEFKLVNDRIYQWFKFLPDLQKDEISKNVEQNNESNFQYFYKIFLENEAKLNNPSINYSAFVKRLIRAVKFEKNKEH